jgi:hypothetical protein
MSAPFLRPVPGLDAKNANALPCHKSPSLFALQSNHFPVLFMLAVRRKYSIEARMEKRSVAGEEVPSHEHSTMCSLRNSSRQDLCSEEAALRSLDDLLVHADRWVVHDDSAGLVVDLGINASVADKVDDPLFAFIVR